MISVRYQGQPFNITVIQVCAANSNAEEAEVERFYEHLWDLLELTPPKDIIFIIGDWDAEVESQEIPGVTGKFGLGVQNEAGQRLIRGLPRERTGNSKHPLPTTQEKTLHRDITRWNQTDSILCSQRWRCSIQSAKTRPGADCASDHELFIAKFRLKLNKVGKATTPSRYDLNQIP